MSISLLGYPSDCVVFFEPGNGSLTATNVVVVLVRLGLLAVIRFSFLNRS